MKEFEPREGFVTNTLATYRNAEEQVLRGLRGTDGVVAALEITALMRENEVGRAIQRRLGEVREDFTNVQLVFLEDHDIELMIGGVYDFLDGCYRAIAAANDGSAAIELLIDEAAGRFSESKCVELGEVSATVIPGDRGVILRMLAGDAEAPSITCKLLVRRGDEGRFQVDGDSVAFGFTVQSKNESWYVMPQGDVQVWQMPWGVIWWDGETLKLVQPGEFAKGKRKIPVTEEWVFAREPAKSDKGGEMMMLKARSLRQVDEAEQLTVTLTNLGITSMNEMFFPGGNCTSHTWRPPGRQGAYEPWETAAKEIGGIPVLRRGFGEGQVFMEFQSVLFNQIRINQVPIPGGRVTQYEAGADFVRVLSEGSKVRLGFGFDGIPWFDWPVPLNWDRATSLILGGNREQQMIVVFDDDGQVLDCRLVHDSSVN